MFNLKFIILLGLGIASQASAQQSCLNFVQSYHPNWRFADLNYVCTARNQFPVDSNPSYSYCVENLAMTSSDGEFIINSCLSGGQGPNRSCGEILQQTRPEWRPVDVKYVCTARNRFVADSNPNYSQCVENLARTSADGEFIINSCLSGGQGPAQSCGEVMRYIHPEWRQTDITYICTARSRIVADSNPNYSSCVENLARTSADGEFIINSCLSGGGSGQTRSCLEQLTSIHPEWSQNDKMYICSARSRIALDSNPSYTSCVVQRSYTSRDGEFIINSCLGGPIQPPPPQYCSCSLVNQWGSFQAQGQNCQIALQNVLQSCSSSNPHAVCAGHQAVCH